MPVALRVLRVAAAAVLAVAALVVPVSPAHQSVKIAQAAGNANWTEYHYDDAHTGNAPGLPQVNTVSAGWVSGSMDDEVYAEPLIFNGAVYSVTLNNTVYAFNESTGATLWSKHVGTPETTGWGCGNINPTGMLGTPIIDAASSVMYVVAEISLNTPTTVDAVYKLFALDLTNSGNVLWSTNLAPGGFDWRIEQERGALALDNGYVLVPMGGRAGDCGNYHGYVMAVQISSHAVTGVYVTQGQGMGIWAGGGVVVDDATGNMFVTTGNGTGTGCDTTDGTQTGPPKYENDSVARLSI